MATATDIIEGALRKLKVISPEIPVEAQYIVNGLSDLNDFGNQLESVFPLGFVTLSSATSEVNIPVETIGMFKSNLAIYISPQYGIQPSPLLINEANTSMNNALIAFGETLTDVDFPDTLPIGSGNQNQLIIEEQRFFSGNKDVNF